MTTIDWAPPRAVTAERDCPFVGLLAYSAEEEEWFFGRERDARLIADNLMAYELTVLYGPSGAGKSSVISAGVLPELRRHAMHQRSLGRRAAVIVIHGTWQSDPIGGLSRSILEAIRTQVTPVPPTANGDSLVERLEAWTSELGTRFVIILDQFEEYLLYHPDPDDPVTLELADAMAESDDGTNFLISIREDAVAQLDRFNGVVPGIFDNTYRIEPLDRASARLAITGPVQHYNELHPEQSMMLEEALIDEVLDRVQVGHAAMSGGLGQPHYSDAVETAELQLVFERLWLESAGAGSRELTKATLVELGGAEHVIQSHLTASLQRLDARERELAGKAFSQLVTPSGSKIAHSVDDLAAYAGASQTEMLALLEKLSASDQRVLRPVAAAPDHADATRFEIFHDVLGPPIVEWTTQRAAEGELRAARASARRERRRRVAATSLALLLVALTAAATFFLVRSVRQSRREESQALAAAAMNELDVDAAGATATALDAYNKSPTPAAQRALRTSLGDLDARVVFSGHTAALTDGAFSPDGTRIVTSSLDGTARLWDANSGAEVAVLSGHVGPVNTADFALDGIRVVTTGADRTIRVWDATTGDQVASLPTSLTTVTSLVVAPDGSTIAAAGAPATVEVWDLQTGTLLQPLDHEPATSVNAATFGVHDGKQILVTGDNTGVVRVWDPHTGEELARWDDLIFINDVSLAENGSWVIIGSYLTDSLVWDWTLALNGSGTEDLVELIDNHSNPDGVPRVSASPDGTHLVSVGDRAAALWRADEVRNAFAPDANRVAIDSVVLRGHSTWVDDVAWSPDGSLLATADANGRIRIWDGRTGSLLNELTGHDGSVLRIAFRSDGTLLSISDDRTARLWNTADDTVFRGHTSWVNAVALYEDTSNGTGMLVSAGADGLVVGSDAETGEQQWTINSDADEAPLGFLQAVAISPDGQYVAAGGLFGIVDVWRVNGGDTVPDRHLTAPAGVVSLRFDPTGTRLAVGLTSGTVELWPWQRPDQPIRSLIWHRGNVVVAFNADGSQIATGGAEGDLRIWNTANGALIKSFDGHDGGVGAIAVSANGREMVSGGGDREVRITDIDSGDVTVLSGHEHFVSAVALDDATDRIVSGDASGFVGIWDKSSGELVSMRRRHALNVNGLVVSDLMKLSGQNPGSAGDDLTIYSAGDDNVVRGYGCTTCGSMADLADDAEERIGFLPQAAGPVPTDTLGSDLTAGTCSDDPGNEFVRLVPVDCELPHDLEYFAAFEWPDPPDSAYPADIDERGARGCQDQAEALFGSWPSDVEVIPFQSTAGAWTNGGRHVQCAFRNLDGSKREGSLVATGGES